MLLNSNDDRQKHKALERLHKKVIGESSFFSSLSGKRGDLQKDLHQPKCMQHKTRIVRPVLAVDGHNAFKNIGFDGAMDFSKLVDTFEKFMELSDGTKVPFVEKHYFNSNYEVDGLEKELQAAGYKCHMGSAAYNERGQLRQVDIDQTIVIFLRNCMKPNTCCNHIVLVTGDADLQIGITSARRTANQALTAWCCGFKGGINKEIWQKQHIDVLFLEDFDVWKHEEIKSQFEIIRKRWADTVTRSLMPSTQEMLKRFEQIKTEDAPPAALPEVKKAFIDAVESNRVVIITGETGCGKSTQLPRHIFETNPKARIVVTQSRRIAARFLAQRVALELGTEGRKVAFRIGGLTMGNTDCCHILYCTTGILLRQLQGSESKLSMYSHIFIDEVHERTFEAELLLSILKVLLILNPDLKIILMSAKIDVKKFHDYFKSVVGLTVMHMDIPKNDQSFKRTILCLEDTYSQVFPLGPPSKELSRSAVFFTPKVLACASKEWTDVCNLDIIGGDSSREFLSDARLNFTFELLKYLNDTRPKSQAFMVFLPGISRILEFKNFCVAEFKNSVHLCLMHSEILNNNGVTEECPNPKTTRKIILSTDIAENAVTFPDVDVVIDLCLQKKMKWSVERQMESLDEEFFTKDIATQRAGRTGRKRDGTVFRILTTKEYDDLPEFRVSQMQLSSVLPHLLGLFQIQVPFPFSGESNPLEFIHSAMDPPTNTQATESAVSEMRHCKLLVKDPSSIAATVRGTKVQMLPLSIENAMLVLYGVAFDCVIPCALAAVVLQQRGSLFEDVKNMQAWRRTHELSEGWPSDLIVWMTVYRLWRKNASNCNNTSNILPPGLNDKTMLEIEALLNLVLARISFLKLFTMPSTTSLIAALDTKWNEDTNLTVMLLHIAAYCIKKERNQILKVRGDNPLGGLGIGAKHDALRTLEFNNCVACSSNFSHCRPSESVAAGAVSGDGNSGNNSGGCGATSAGGNSGGDNSSRSSRSCSSSNSNSNIGSGGGVSSSGSINNSSSGSNSIGSCSSSSSSSSSSSGSIDSSSFSRSCSSSNSNSKRLSCVAKIAYWIESIKGLQRSDIRQVRSLIPLSSFLEFSTPTEAMLTYRFFSGATSNCSSEVVDKMKRECGVSVSNVRVLPSASSRCCAHAKGNVTLTSGSLLYPLLLPTKMKNLDCSLVVGSLYSLQQHSRLYASMLTLVPPNFVELISWLFDLDDGDSAVNNKLFEDAGNNNAVDQNLLRFAMALKKQIAEVISVDITPVSTDHCIPGMASNVRRGLLTIAKSVFHNTLPTPFHPFTHPIPKLSPSEKDLLCPAVASSTTAFSSSNTAVASIPSFICSTISSANCATLPHVCMSDAPSWSKDFVKSSGNHLTSSDLNSTSDDSSSSTSELFCDRFPGAPIPKADSNNLRRFGLGTLYALYILSKQSN